MNYLALVKRALMEAGASGSNNVTTLTGASGELLRFATWVNQAWLDIQTKREDWLFMRKPIQFNLIPNQGAYPYNSAPLSLTDFGMWLENSFRIYKDDPNGELRLQFLEWESFNNCYLLGSTRFSYGMPNIISVSPSRSLVFALPPNYAYTVLGEYQRMPTSLLVDTDVPDLPERWQIAIVWKALMYYGAYETYPEKYTNAQETYKGLMRLIEIEQLPSLTRNGSF